MGGIQRWDRKCEMKLFSVVQKKFQAQLQALENQREKLKEQKVAEEQRDQKCLVGFSVFP